MSDGFPEPRAIPTQLQKDLELMRLRGIDCRDNERSDIWRQSAYQIARLVNSALTSREATEIWTRVETSPCLKALAEQDHDWFRLYGAIARRDNARMAAIGTRLLEGAEDLTPGQVQYLLTAALSGEIARGEIDEAVYLWNKFAQTAAGANIDFNLRVLFAQIAAAGRSNTKSPLK